MNMLIRFPMALLAIFLASNAIATMDQGIPQDKIIYAAQKCVSEILAVPEPPYGEKNDCTDGFWMQDFAYFKATATMMIIHQGQKAAKATESLRYYTDPEFNTWRLIKMISEESPNVQHPREKVRDLLSWSIPYRVPFFYSAALRTLISNHPISHENPNMFFAQTCCRLSDAIINHIQQGSHYSALIDDWNRGMLTDEEYLELEESSIEGDSYLKTISDYNVELWNWYANHGVAEGTHERLTAAGAREVLMQTYKAADSL